MTLKKLTLAAAASIALASSAFADTTAANGQWGVGVGIYNYINSTNPALNVTFLNNQFLAQAGVGYHNDSAGNHTRYNSSINFHEYDTYVSFGLRNMMNNQVGLDYGVNGSYGFSSSNNSNEKDPYAVGAFVGLDFMPVQNVLFTAAIDPYMHERQYSTVKTNSVFHSGSLSVSYMFG